jgi:hypothetical protein
MLARIWTILRTIYLLVMVAYALWATPWMPLTVARTFDEQYSRCASSLVTLQRATWLAIAWIALETLVGWGAIWRRARAERAKAAAPPASPPGP